MTISIRCDGCNSTYNVPDAMVGKKAKCKKCGQILAVAAPPRPKPVEAAAKIEAMCGQCGAKYAVGLAMAGKRAKCQKCGSVFEVPDPNAPQLVEVDPIMAVEANDPLAGLGGNDWSDPLGGAMDFAATTMPLPQHIPGRPPAKKPGRQGIPTIVWIAAGGGGGALLLILLLVMFLFSGGDDDDANGGGTASGGSTSSSGSNADDNLPPINDAVAWTFKADLPIAGPANLLQQPLKLLDRPSENYFARGDVAQATISYGRHVDGKYDVLIQQLDLKTGQPLAEQAFDQYTKLLGLSPDGTAFLILPAANYAAYETLQVWRWSGKAAAQVGEWTPYKNQTSKRIAWSMMLDTDRIATGHSQEKVGTIWSAKGKRVSRFPDESGKQPGMSPGGKYLVQHSGIWLRFFDVATLKHVGSIGPLSSEYVNFSGLAYRPDGQAIAATFHHPNGSTFVVWNAASRQKQVEFEIPTLSSPLIWIADDHVLAGAYLLSLSNEMPVWNYVGLAPYAQTSERRVMHYLTAGSEKYLAAAMVPSAEVLSHIDDYVAANVPILKAGDSVALQVQVTGATPAADFQQKLTQTFSSHLQTAGYTIADGSPFRLRVTLEDKDSGKKLEYHMMGRGSGSGNISVPDKHIECEVAFVDSADAVVWRTNRSIGPSFMSFNRGGETDLVKSLLDSRWNSFNSWVQNIRIAAQVRKYSSIGEFGSSTLQADGERIVKVSGN